jgi:hypothetical protein
MPAPWETDVATESPPWESSETPPWEDSSPVQAPDLSKIKLDASQMLTDPVTGLKRESGMESGTELTTALAGGVLRGLKALTEIPDRLKTAITPLGIEEYTIPKDAATAEPPTVKAPSRQLPMTTVLGGKPQPIGNYDTSPEERQTEFVAGAQRPAVSLDVFKIPEEKDDPAWAATIKEAWNLLVGIPEFMESPLGMATMGVGATGKVAAIAVRLAFAGDMIKSLFEQWPNLKDNWDTMSDAEKGRAIARFLGTGAMAGLLAHPEARGTVKDPLANVADRTGQLAPDPIRLSPGGRPVFGAEAKPLPSELLTAPGGAMATQIAPPAQRDVAPEVPRGTPAPATAPLPVSPERPVFGQELTSPRGAEPGRMPATELPVVAPKAEAPAPAPAASAEAPTVEAAKLDISFLDKPMGSHGPEEIAAMPDDVWTAAMQKKKGIHWSMTADATAWAMNQKSSPELLTKLKEMANADAKQAMAKGEFPQKMQWYQDAAHALSGDEVGLANIANVKQMAEKGQIKIKPAAPEKGMPPSQDLGAAVPAAFDNPESFVSNMFAAIDRDRVAMGKEPMGDTRPRTWDEDNQRALSQMNRDPNWIPDLLDRMEKQPRPLLSWENAGVVWHRAKLKAEYNGALQRVARAFDDNRAEDLTAAKTDAAVFEDKLERLDRIVGRNGTGSEAGRSLNAQKMGAGDDFTLVEMTLQKRAAVGGRRLTPQETSSIQKDVDQLNSLNAALQKSLADADARASSAEAARAVAELKASLPGFDQRVLKAAENIVVKMEGRAVDASARLREKIMRMSAGVDPTILYDASVIGSARIARLGLDLAKFTDSMVRDFGEKIRPLIGDIWQKSNEMLDANLARVPEPIRRVVKKTGAQDVRKEVAAAVKSDVDAGDMSKVTWQVQKLARELVKSGITEREALIDAVHDALKDVIPSITRRGTMDAISGYGDFKRLSKDRISLTLRGMKGEMQQLAKLEDMAGGKPPLKTGIERREATPEERRLIKEVNDAKNKFQVPIDNPDTQLKSALDTLKTTLKNRIADFEDRLARKDYSPRPRREVQLDTEAARLRAEAERIKKRWRESLLSDRMKNRTVWEKVLDLGTKFRRFTALSSPNVIPKLLGAAGWRAVSTLAEDVSGRAMSFIPGIRQISQRAPLEGYGGQLSATMRGFGAAFTQGLKDALKVTKTGHSDIDVLYGKASESYTGESEMASMLLGLPGRLHGTIKAPVKRGAFEKAAQRLGEFYARQGLDVTSEPVKYRIALEAYKAGNRSIFLQDNRVASGFNAALQALEKKGETGHPSPGGKVLATAARFMFPVTRVPTNIAAETLQYATGSVTGSVRAINAIRKGLDTLTPDQADLIMRELKKGSVGMAALYLGYMGYQSIGGVYEQGKKRKAGDVKPDAARMFGVDIPGNLLHAPVLNTIQLGATVHRTAEDKLRRKDADVQGIPAGVMAASWGLAEEVPFIQGPSRLFQGLKSPYTRQQTIGSEVGSVAIPQAVAWVAQVLDQRRETPPDNLYQRITGPPARLKPRNIGESLETRIPGLRQNVPVNPKAVTPAAPAAPPPPWEKFR